MLATVDIYLFLFFLALGILDVVVYLYRYIVYFAMRERTPRSYYMNIILLFVDSAYIAFSAAQTSFSDTSFWLLFPIEFIIASLIWALPNIIYFKHRKNLFGIVSSESNPRTVYTIDPSPTPITPIVASNSGLVQKQYCPYCGKALPYDSAFCQYCGKKLSQ